MFGDHKMANRQKYYEKVYKDKAFDLVTVKKPDGFYYQGQAPNGKKVGRPFKIDGESHKRLAKMFPQKIPPPTGFAFSKKRLVSERSRNITRNFKAEDWKNLGFATKRQGEDVVRELRKTGINFLSSPEVLSKVLNALKAHEGNIEEKLAKRQNRIVGLFNNNIGRVNAVEQNQPYKSFIRNYELTVKGNLLSSPNGFYRYMNTLKPRILYLASRYLQASPKGIRLMLTSLCDFKNDIHPENKASDKELRASSSTLIKNQFIHHLDQVEPAVDKMIKIIIRKIEEFISNGSGWVLDKIKKTYLNMGHYEPPKGSQWFEVPKELVRRKGVVNFKNSDEYCFWYAMVYACEKENIKHHAERVKQYEKYLLKYPRDQSDYPMEVHINHVRLKKQEDLFKKNIHVHLVNVDKPNDVMNVIASASSYEDSVDLLLVQDTLNNKRHFMYIDDLGKFRSTDRNYKHICRNCYSGFRTKQALDTHFENCKNHRATTIKMPEQKKAFCKFQNIYKQLEVPFVIYADAETWFDTRKEKKGDNSEILASHIPSGIFAVVYSRLDHAVVKEFYYRGEGCMEEWRLAIQEYASQLNYDYFMKEKHIKWATGDYVKHKKATHCHICNEPFPNEDEIKAYKEEHNKKHPDYKVADHCHFTGWFRGSAHNRCNFLLHSKRLLPVMFHNFRGYDSHLLISSMRKNVPKLSIIPNSKEKFLSFSASVPEKHYEDRLEEFKSEYLRTTGLQEVDDTKLRHLCREKTMELCFMDTMTHLSTGLDKLVEMLDVGDLKATNAWVKSLSVSDDDFELKMKECVKKGEYPYEYMTSWLKFDETELPPSSAFFSSLKFQGKTFKELSREEKEELEKKRRRALVIWKMFGCKTMWDFHDFYMKLDVYLLCDVFEKYRSTSLDKFGLDPCHYPTISSLCWDSMLKVTKITLELFTDMDMYLFCEKAKIGGISMVGSKRYSKANHKYLQSFDPEAVKKFIVYGDANALYPWAMIQKLPFSEFKWVEPSDFDLAYALTQTESDYACFLEIDIDIPKELHDKFKDYPPFPENILITNDMLSQKQQETKQLLTELKSFHETGVKKLVPNLMNKKKYPIHIKYLKLCLELFDGLVKPSDVKIHRVLSFRQKAWLEPYITLCQTERKKKGICKFEKDFWKLCCNGVYGKTMENMRDRVTVDITTDEETIKKSINDVRFENMKINDSGLCMTSRYKTSTTLNKPIYAGVTVLNLSKILMYDLWYNKLKKQYGNALTLLYTDTDSFIFEVETDDFFRDVDCDLWDFSDYNESHPLFSETNKKVAGKMKDEGQGIPIAEFVGLRAKQYAFVLDNSVTNLPVDKSWSNMKCVGKGINKQILKSTTFDSYYRALNHENKKENLVQTVDMVGFQSYNHNLKTVKQTKLFQSPFDDKRWLCGDGVHQLPYGHYACIY